MDWDMFFIHSKKSRLFCPKDFNRNEPFFFQLHPKKRVFRENYTAEKGVLENFTRQIFYSVIGNIVYFCLNLNLK